MADKKFMTRFRRELEVTAQAAVTPRPSASSSTGRPKTAAPTWSMELLTGVSLADRLEQGDIGEIEGLQYARQIAERPL